MTDQHYGTAPCGCSRPTDPNVYREILNSAPATVKTIGGLPGRPASRQHQGHRTPASAADHLLHVRRPHPMQRTHAAGGVVMGAERVYTATIRDTETGEVRQWSEEAANCGPSTIAFMWCDGNQSCDCNRASFLFSNDPERDDDEFECNVRENRFQLDALRWSDGTLLAEQNDRRLVWEDEEVPSYVALVVGEFLQAVCTACEQRQP